MCSKSAGQFFYTISQFVDECPYVEGSDTVPPPDFRGPKIVFEPNQSRKVIPFAPSVPVSIPASEALGRPFVQLKLSHFTEFCESGGFRTLSDPMREPRPVTPEPLTLSSFARNRRPQP